MKNSKICFGLAILALVLVWVAVSSETAQARDLRRFPGVDLLSFTIGPRWDPVSCIHGGEFLPAQVRLGGYIEASALRPIFCPPSSIVTITGSDADLVPRQEFPVGPDGVATFLIETNGVAVDTDVEITASYRESPLAATQQIRVTLTFKPARLKSFSIDPRRIQGGQPVSLEFALLGKAPPDGLWIDISNSPPGIVRADGAYAISGGESSVEYLVNTFTVEVEVDVTLQAWLDDVGIEATVTVEPAETEQEPGQVRVFNPTLAKPGKLGTGDLMIQNIEFADYDGFEIPVEVCVRLSEPAPNDLTVQLELQGLSPSLPSIEGLPASLSFAAGQDRLTYTIYVSANADQTEPWTKAYVVASLGESRGYATITVFSKQ